MKVIGMEEIAMIPKPVDGSKNTEGILSPSIQKRMIKYFLVLILRILTELINEMLPKAVRRKIKPEIIRKAMLKINLLLTNAIP